MDSFEWNKIFAAILTVLFLILGASFLSDIVFHGDTPEKAGFEIAGGESHSDDKGDKKEEKAGPTIEPVDDMLASADIAKGEKVAKKCLGCHNFAEGSKNKIGPTLYGIVNRAIAGVDGFGYSAAMKTYGEGKTWTYEELNKFLYKPKVQINKTSMNFPGLKKTADRAALIAYLRSLAATPAPLPGN